MSVRFKEARLIKKIKLIEAAKMLEVSQPTLSGWEAERKAPSLDSLKRMAKLYGVTTDFLLGLDSDFTIENATTISKQALPVLHSKPVWIPNIGWALVNAIDKILLLANGDRFQFDEIDNLMLAPERFCESTAPGLAALSRVDIQLHEEIWVEPISKDISLRQELRGWYRLKDRFVENDAGNRFTLDSYGAKWLAFESNK